MLPEILPKAGLVYSEADTESEVRNEECLFLVS